MKENINIEGVQLSCVWAVAINAALAAPRRCSRLATAKKRNARDIKHSNNRLLPITLLSVARSLAAITCACAARFQGGSWAHERRHKNNQWRLPGGKTSLSAFPVMKNMACAVSAAWLFCGIEMVINAPPHYHLTLYAAHHCYHLPLRCAAMAGVSVSCW